MPKHDEQNIHHKQQHDRHLQHQHPPIIPVLLQNLINIIQRLKLLIHRFVPIPQMKAR